MTPLEYRAAIAALSLTQGRAATMFGVSLRAGQNWARRGPPVAVAVALWLILHYGLKPRGGKWPWERG
jgi:hypothetical protein